MLSTTELQEAQADPEVDHVHRAHGGRTSGGPRIEEHHALIKKILEYSGVA